MNKILVSFLSLKVWAVWWNSVDKLTAPQAAIELNPQTNTHHAVSQGVEPDHSRYDGRTQVF